MLKNLLATICISSAIGSNANLPLNDSNSLSGLDTYYIGEVDLDFTRVDYLPMWLYSYDGDEYTGVLRFNTRFITRVGVAIDRGTIEYTIPTFYIHFYSMEVYFNAHFTGYLQNGDYDTVVEFNNIVGSTFSLNTELFTRFISQYNTITGNEYNVTGAITYLSQDTLVDMFGVTLNQVYDEYDISVSFMGLNKGMFSEDFYNGHFDESLDDTYYYNLFSTENNQMEKNPIPYIYDSFKNYYYGVMSGDGSLETYNRGYNNGYNDGYNAAYSIGYNVGYDAALGANGTAITIFNGILSIGMLPINIFLKILNFDILGINMANFISALLSICLTLIIIRTILGTNK